MKCKAVWFDCMDGFSLALKTDKGERIVVTIPEQEIKYEGGIWSGDGEMSRSRKKRCDEILEEIWGSSR